MHLQDIRTESGWEPPSVSFVDEIRFRSRDIDAELNRLDENRRLKIDNDSGT